MALGADLVGMARPVLSALDAGGVGAALGLLGRVEDELRTTMLLTGSADLRALRRARRLLGPDLRAWQAGGGGSEV
jgi:isopentenyl-diphosphate delta-isomerase